MKANIHPKYEATTVKCVCGAIYETKSTISLEKIDICASCHPFYTGKTKIIDTEGRIEKFKKKFGTDYTKTTKK
jgi:large subunit ribosomal protein L31